jgi:hypothetical protein
MPIHDWTRVGTYVYHDFHGDWIYAIRRVLNNGVLPPGYYALADQVTRTIGPDVLTLQAAMPSNTPSSDQSSIREGQLAVRDTPPRVRMVGAAPARPPQFRQRRVTIRHSSSDRLIAIIELVSPGNKSSSYALQKFVSKIVRALDAGIHALVIDPFPPGKRDSNGIHGVIWPELGGDPYTHPADAPLTQVSYESPDAGGGEPHCYIEPLAVGGRLADMPLFLEPGYYVNIPLEQSYLDAFVDVLPQHRALLEPQGAS